MPVTSEAVWRLCQTMAGATGVSIYIPKGGVTVAYDRLAFAEDTRWGKLLEAYTS